VGGAGLRTGPGAPFEALNTRRTELARRRVLAGEANHLELFFLSHRYGKPKNLDGVPERPPDHLSAP
jgi:hypothetical protein